MNPVSLEFLSAPIISKKDFRRCKTAQKAVKKANRKWRKAIHKSSILEMEIALGMAQVALKKAKFAASAKLR